MNKKEIQELFEYMTSSNESIFVNDFAGWTEEAKIPGYDSFAAMEGNGIKSQTTGESYVPQYESVRCGNHLDVQFRHNGEVIKRVRLAELFQNVKVVIVTGGESLRKLAPMFNRRSELIDWLMQVHCYCEQRQTSGNPVPWFWESDMIALATFFYKNAPDKIVDQSIYDRLTAV